MVELQDQVFEFLADARAHGGQDVLRVDTHLSAVFLAGDRAYKVMRAVRFPFVDFSTLPARKTACESEIAVNRSFAPQIYRRALPVTREPDGSLALDGKGAPVEWAVEMLRFDEEQTLDRMADNGKIDEGVADALGRAVAAVHEHAPAVAARSWIDALSTYAAQNDAAFAENPELFPPDDAARLRSETAALLQRLDPLLAARGALVRRAHGDLHLGNIVMLDGRPVLFDAIAFDPLIASGDVLYDLAFLLMDLLNRDLSFAANVVLNRYLAETHRAEDLDGLAALPLFLSLRAAIRAKVTAARLETASEEKSAGIAKAACAYFDLALRLLAPAAPMLAAVGGLSGTGKSVLSRRLASALPPPPGAVVLRSDVERKALFGRAETDRLPAEAYRPEVSARVYVIMEEKARRILAAGHSVIVDAVFARRAERDAIKTIAEGAAAPFHGLFLTADLAVRLARVGSRGPDASDVNAAIVREQEDYALGTMEWTTVDASGSPGDTLKAARDAIDSK